MKREFTFLSKEGKTNIHAIEWIPEGKVLGVLQICHGMVEYIDRYHDFAEYMAGNGYYVVGHDHLGHGQSVTSAENLGYFAEKDGNACVIADIHTLRQLTAEKYPDVPYVMLGHSMGSFLLRQYLGTYAEGLTAAIIMGTGQQPDLILGAGKMICRLIAGVKGWTHRSKLVNGMAIGGYNKRFAKENCPAAWLSKDTGNTMKYASDPLCTYIFTVNAYYNMFIGMSIMNRQEKAGQFRKGLPILLVAGQDDPVGNFGKSVDSLYKFYKKHGIQDVQRKLYAEDRHEILNELDKAVVYEDILNWINEKGMHL